MSRHVTGEFDFGTEGDHPRKRIRYERDETEPPSVAVATALAEFNREDVTEASTSLYEYIDPEALDALFANRYDGGERAGGQVRFDVGRATVVVRPTSVHVYSAGRG